MLVYLLVSCSSSITTSVLCYLCERLDFLPWVFVLVMTLVILAPPLVYYCTNFVIIVICSTWLKLTVGDTDRFNILAALFGFPPRSIKGEGRPPLLGHRDCTVFLFDDACGYCCAVKTHLRPSTPPYYFPSPSCSPLSAAVHVSGKAKSLRYLSQSAVKIKSLRVNCYRSPG